MKRKPAIWLIGYLLLVCIALGLVAAVTIRIDPFIHYHMPDTEEYFYPLDNQRSQNDGIIRHFEYTGIITGSSTTECFRTTEAEDLWGCTFIKVPYSGASYKESNGAIETAIRNHPDVRVVIRSLDMGKFTNDKDEMRSDLGEFPTYLYDDDLLNDVHYIFNRDVVFSRVYPMIKAKGSSGFTPGITSFDEYSSWMKKYKFGRKALFPDGIDFKGAGKAVTLSDKLARKTKANIEQNVTAIARDNPDITFYCFIPPYSAKFWMEKVENGIIYRQIEAERVVIEALLKCPNIRLYSFNCRFDLTMDLNNYRDYIHYGEWINSFILRCMYEDRYRLTEENYADYLYDELQYYLNYDYTQLNDQADYGDDYYAAVLLAKEAYGLDGEEIDLAGGQVELRNAEVIEGQHEGKQGVRCTGRLDRDPENKDVTAGDYIRDTDYIGFKLNIADITPYRYIVFYGSKTAEQGQPSVYVYDKDGRIAAQRTASHSKISSQWTPYVINVTDLAGEACVVFNGGCTDNTGSPESQYIFSDVKLY